MFYVYVTNWNDEDSYEHNWLSEDFDKFSPLMELAKPFTTWEAADTAAKQAGAVKYTILKA